MSPDPKFHLAIGRLAGWALHHPEALAILPQTRHERLLLHVEDEAFDNSHSWTVEHDHVAKQYTVRKCTFRRDLLAGRLEHLTVYLPKLAPQPPIEVRDAVLDRLTWERLLEEGRGLRMAPLFPGGSLGLDGVTYTLETFSGMSSCKLHWWCDQPREWAALHEWAGRVRKQLDSAVAESTPVLNGMGGLPIDFPAGVLDSPP